MRVTYAINARIGGGGIGNTALYALRAIQRRGWLQLLVASSLKTHEFDRANLRMVGSLGRLHKRLELYDRTQLLDRAVNAAFDKWVASQMPACDIFHGWNNHALDSIAAAKRKGAKTIVERGGAHVRQSLDLVQDEFERWGWTEPVTLPAVADKSSREFEAADFVMVPSQYNLDSFTARGFPREKILLLPLGVDTQKFRPADRPDDARPFRALFVGQVSLRKGIPYVLQAWRKAALTDAELMIVGQQKPDVVRAIASSLGDPTIRWIGHVADPVALYQSADVFVFPSLEEGSALVTYEAMACGLPSIVTPNAGSLIRDQVDGFIVPIRDSEAIADKLTWLATHRAERLALGAAARAAIEPMTWDRYGDRLAELYETVIGAGQLGRAVV